MRPYLASIFLLAACGGSAPKVGNKGPRGAAPDLGTLFAADEKSANVLAKHLVAAESDPDDKNGESAGPIDGKRRAYDFDGDGVVDLKVVSQVMYGPSQGWVVSVRDGKEYQEAFALSGDWDHEADDGTIVSLRYNVSTLAPGEPVFSTLIRYDRRTKAWSAPVKAFMSKQTDLPKLVRPFTSVTTPVAATLRATPAIDDSPKKDLEAMDDGGGFALTATLLGNVLSRFEPGARGLVLAAKGEWRFVAFDPATPPKENSLSHGLDNDATGRGWLLGWVKASEVGLK